MQTIHRIVRSLAVVAAAGCAAGLVQAQDKVTFNMSWLPQGSVIGPIVAQTEGYYKAAGLDVNLVRGYGGNRTANELDQGQFEFGYVDPISIVLNRSNGGKVRLVGAINTTWPGGICYVTKRYQPKSIDDMKGMTLGGGSASPVHNVVPAVARAQRQAEGLDPPAAPGPCGGRRFTDRRQDRPRRVLARQQSRGDAEAGGGGGRERGLGRVQRPRPQCLRQRHRDHRGHHRQASPIW